MAAKNVGDAVELDGFTGRVKEVFRSTVKQADGEGLTSLKAGTVFYGLAGTNEFNALQARWNGEGISYYRGQVTTDKKVEARFSTGK